MWAPKISRFKPLRLYHKFVNPAGNTNPSSAEGLWIKWAGSCYCWRWQDNDKRLSQGSLSLTPSQTRKCFQVIIIHEWLSCFWIVWLIFAVLPVIRYLQNLKIAMLCFSQYYIACRFWVFYILLRSRISIFCLMP
jgi:hypothetical protein